MNVGLIQTHLYIIRIADRTRIRRITRVRTSLHSTPICRIR